MSALPLSMTEPGIRDSLREWAILDRAGERLSANASRVWTETRDAQEDAWAQGAGRAAPGLVSVPTSGARASAGLSTAVSRGEVADLRKSMDAFTIDKNARRLAKLRMNVGAAARLHAAIPNGRRAGRCIMVTLTYRGDNSAWDPRHVSDCLKACREHLKRRGHPLRYCWVAELQQRGVIHYHVAIWLPHGVKLPKFDRAGWWPWGMTNVIVAKHAPAYLCKYMSKGSEFDKLPKGARAYGVGGLVKEAQACRRWLNWPSMVQGNCAAGERAVRAPGGGWLMPDGSRLASEFQRVWIGDGPSIQRIHTHPRAIDPAGPFSWLKAA